jgi:hypothetical protein
LRNLTLVLEAQKKYKDAEPVYRRAGHGGRAQSRTQND